MKRNFIELFRSRGYDESDATRSTNFLLRIPVVSNMNATLLVDAFAYYQKLDSKEYGMKGKYFEKLDPTTFAADMEAYMNRAGWKQSRDVNFEELKTSFLRYLNVIDDQYKQINEATYEEGNVPYTILAIFFGKYM